MPRISPNDWTPRGVDSLESAADEVVRSSINCAVIAGPGAGKTELLAQRACFLLDTGLCTPPKRILAISFKRDAAKNLNERVKKRCGALARRFDSMTLDAFGKGLVDRFRSAIPKEWRPTLGYEVRTSFPRPQEMRDWFLSVVVPNNLTAPNFRAKNDSWIRRNYEICQFGSQIPFDNLDECRRHYSQTLWQETLGKPVGQPSITFPMLNRLAAFLLRQNPKLLRALRATYSHVFMDEFQDTTDSQYDLARTAFGNSSVVVSAVGDSKQKIMTWAGAMENAFERFSGDFGARRHDLIRNYRSAPELVSIQHFIAQAIESEAVPAEAARPGDGSSSCKVLEFCSPETEASYLSELIAEDIQSGKLGPRDFCVLARQRTADIIKPMLDVEQNGLFRIRDESTLQDLLAEPIAALLLSLMRLATRDRDPEAWELLHTELNRLHGEESTETTDDSAREAERLLRLTRYVISDPSFDRSELLSGLVHQIGEKAVRSSYRQYRTGNFLWDTTKKLGDMLSENSNQSLATSVNALIGEDAVPAMTVHKSKGLEFHTIIFLGLEDSQLWNFANQSEEEVRGFFVAFSRAIERVIFTFSDVRDGRYGREPQERTAISDLYTLLNSAGVEVVNCRKK